MLDELEVRRQKLEALKAEGVNPYPKSAHRDTMIGELVDSFDAVLASQSPKILAGRVLITRVHGAMMFADLVDDSGRIQLMFKEDETKDFAGFRDRIDPGDIVEVTGVALLTKRGQKSLLVSSWTILAKALRPLPEKWHGLQDIETRYRERELDLISNEDVRKRFVVRTKLVSALRRFLDERGFMEVETPMLQPIPGGANARPFVTHHNALDIDLYLRIAPEIYLKRLVIGGFEKIYEIGRNFRNEGIDYSHNPEFTSIELYWAYAEKDAFVTFLEEVTMFIIRQSVGSLEVPYQGSSIDFNSPWKRVTFREAVEQACGIDIDGYKDPSLLVAAVKEKGIEVDFSGCVGLGEHYDQLFKKTARAAFTQPVWVFDYPVELKPLANRSPSDPSKSASVQLVVQGAEIINAYYHELNDPIDQRARFMEQEKMREQGSEEAQHIDESFLRALEHGMPPTAGMAIGIDRLVAFLTDAPNLKEVILFPTLRPEGTEGNEPKKSKEIQVAHAVILDAPDIPHWSKLNTAAHLGASFAARKGKELIAIESTDTSDQERILMNIQHAILMKETDDKKTLLALKRAGEQAGLSVVCFTEDMRNSTNDRKVKEQHAGKSSDEVVLLGVLLFGPKSTVENLTKVFSLAK